MPCVVQDNYEFLTRCIKEDLGFKNGKPVAASIIYKCLLHWHAFESERTAIFDYIIDGINEVIKVSNLLIFFVPPFVFLLCSQSYYQSFFCVGNNCSFIVLYYISFVGCSYNFYMRFIYFCGICFRSETMTLSCHIGCPIPPHLFAFYREMFVQMVF